ncbi:DNA-processing protein DprA [Leucobacter ruminantium]|uniref:DNA-protecting protein DprA n=1 Tax=Leucobacter ruminantium TaxID=1289170 RepID=A0A939M007_9MICO|nr:DNA-protecting protein DprA [Leucobacter ruminantium]
MTDYTEDMLARMTLTALTDPGDPITGKLVQAIGLTETLALIRDADAAIPAQVNQFEGARWLQKAAARQKDTLVDDLVALAERGGLRLLTPGRAGWPADLTDLGPSAPLVLWAKGNPELLTSSLTSRVTITGARAATAYGVHLTHEFAEQLAQSPRILVSGGAYGIDAETHRAALAVRSGSTIAVLAGGVDRPYPVGNASLFQRITDGGGLLISEVPPGLAPSKDRFVARARLMAALSGATVVPEAGPRSGSLRVAVSAFDLGRRVGAVPGPITSAASSGCHLLLAEGFAEVITNAWDVEAMSDPSPEAYRLPPAYQQAARRAAPDVSRSAGRAAL